MTLGYDPALRLYQVAGGTTTRFAYDGANAIADYDGSNALQHRYVFAGMDQPIVQYDASGNRAFLGSDERGSVISLTDSSGTLIALNKYDEYGKPASGNSGRFQYTGQMWLSEIGAYYYKARVYLPHLGIFAQTDPVGYAGDGPNLYAYALNDPVNFTDPSGLGVVLDDPNAYTVLTQPAIIVTGTRPPIIITGPRQPHQSNSDPSGKSHEVPVVLYKPVTVKTPGEDGGRRRAKPKAPHHAICPTNELLNQVGEELQNQGLLYGGLGALGTALAPETGVPEAAVAFGLGLYSAGTALKDSVSIENAILNGGDLSGYALGRINQFALNRIPEGPVRNFVESALDEAEHGVGLDSGDQGTCRQLSSED